MTKAPLGGKTGPNPTDRGKAGVKRSLTMEGHGVPIVVTIEGARRHDIACDAGEHFRGATAADGGATATDVFGQGYDDEEVRAILCA